MSHRDDIDKALAVVAEYLSRRPLVRRRLAEQVNAGLRAQALEVTRQSGHSIVEDEDTSVPAVSDRTGEAAIRTDRARRMLADLDRAEQELVAATAALAGVASDNAALLVSVHVWARPLGPTLHRSAAVMDRILGEVLGRRRPQVDRSMDGDPGCQSCGRLRVKGVPWWNEPNYYDGNPTDVGGILKAKLKLCRGCMRFVVEFDRLPTVQELRHKHDDPRGRWPKRYAKAS